MKILAVCGSPHRGNCHSMLEFIREKYPDIDFSIIMLGEVNLEQCRGCYLCVTKGEDKCPLDDDLGMILEKMREADGVLFASPVYVNHISALMKQFIDRLGYIAHRPSFFGKQAMVMSVCAGFGADKANDYMSGMFTVFGFDVASSLELQIAAHTEREKTHTRQKTLEAFDRFISRIREGRGQAVTPSLMQLIYFNVFKSIAELTRETNVADYEFYEDRGDFIFDVKINPLKNRLAQFIAKREVQKVMANR
jgi:multimeric flavodoxin WrbA